MSGRDILRPGLLRTAVQTLAGPVFNRKLRKRSSQASETAPDRPNPDTNSEITGMAIVLPCSLEHLPSRPCRSLSSSLPVQDARERAFLRTAARKPFGSRRRHYSRPRIVRGEDRSCEHGTAIASDDYKFRWTASK